MSLLFPLIFIIAFPLIFLYKHFVKKEKQDFKTLFTFMLFFLTIWAIVIYIIKNI